MFHDFQWKSRSRWLDQLSPTSVPFTILEDSAAQLLVDDSFPLGRTCTSPRVPVQSSHLQPPRFLHNLWGFFSKNKIRPLSRVPELFVSSTPSSGNLFIVAKIGWFRLLGNNQMRSYSEMLMICTLTMADLHRRVNRRPKAIKTKTRNFVWIEEQPSVKIGKNVVQRTSEEHPQPEATSSSTSNILKHFFSFNFFFPFKFRATHLHRLWRHLCFSIYFFFLFGTRQGHLRCFFVTASLRR